ncbi:hypothetical protein [Brevibacterium pigmentatum]|uniref:hypothetical protein n=1 Tax=Brevibacterium pigmentatum TaxID=1496080 RepID=UPI00141EA5E6|nr:hypothetical protein [Brevibacterium pigmentatum]
MSLQRLEISAWARLSAKLAGVFTLTSVCPGALVAALVFLPLDFRESATERFTYLTASLISTAVLIVVCQRLIRGSLGRFRTSSSLTRFLRYQLGALGCGAGLGIGFLPVILETAPSPDHATPAQWVSSICAGLGLLVVSLLTFRGDRRSPLTAPAHPSMSLTEGIVVDYWSDKLPSGATPSLAVIRFADESGRARSARHLVRRSTTTLGTMGRAQYDLRRPDKVLGFTSGRPPFAKHPSRTRRQKFVP